MKIFAKMLKIEVQLGVAQKPLYQQPCLGKKR